LVKCKNCLEDKELNEFRCKILNNKAYYARICKKCVVEKESKKRKTNEYRMDARDDYAKNKEKINARRRSKYGKKLPRQTIKQSKEEKFLKNLKWRENNPEKLKTYNKNYHDSHKEKEKEYRKSNKEKIFLSNKEYMSRNEIKRKYALQTQKRRKIPEVKLRNNISSLIRIFLNKNGNKKNRKSILDVLPYTMADLKIHIEKQFEPWMNWDNKGRYMVKTWNDNDQSTWKWQLDHIIPQSDFPYTSMDEDNFKKCWALENLRPLSAKLNLIEGTNRIRHIKNENNSRLV